MESKEIKIGSRVKLTEDGKSASTPFGLSGKPKNHIFKGTVTAIRDEFYERYTVKMDDDGFTNCFDGSGYNRFCPDDIEVVQDEDN